MYKYKTQSGFTLIELMIALLIMMMVSVLCANGFRFAIKIWTSIDTQASQVDHIQSAQGFLRKSISNALIREPIDIEDQEADIPTNLFLGDSNRLRYISYSPSYGNDDYLYTYELFHDKSNNTLRLNYRPYNLFDSGKNREKYTMLLENISDLKIEYFSGYATDKNGWAPHWRREFLLPLLVKVKVISLEKNVNWPDLVIQMRNGPYVIR